MQTLTELEGRIHADAGAKLTTPAGRSPADEMARYRGYLKLASNRIQRAHRAGAGGVVICRALAFMVDELVRHLWDASKASLSTQAQREFPPMALVGLGGYGRAELNPRSDIDIMFLHEGQVVAGAKPLPSLARLIDGIYYPLLNLHFKVGQCVRTIADCTQVAQTSMQTKTSLIEARLVTGDAKLFEKFQKAVVSKCVEGLEEAYIAERLEDQAARRKKFGDSPTMQEPNIKNGCGGLRDYQNLHWMAFFKYRTRTLADLEQREFISAMERKQLEVAYDFLLRVRNELHYQTNRALDVLSKSVQPPVALKLGYDDRSPLRRLEKFMRDFYTHARNIYLITRTIEERLALQPKAASRLGDLGRFIRAPFRKAPPAAPVDGFVFTDGQIYVIDKQVLKTQPRRLMRVFLHAQQRGLKLHPDLAHLLRQDLPLLKRTFLYDEHARTTFLEILNQRGNVARVLRSMHEVGLLGKYLPEFGKLTNLVQHEFYHQYAADEHTLVCLERLDELWESTAPARAHYAEIFHQIERPFVLYLALLLHDVGKASDFSDHAEAGGRCAQRVAQRLRLDGTTGHSLRLLIENHLVMASVSQRRDLDDPAVIGHFAALVQTPENLRMLTLMTVADTLATSEKLWNGFKDLLLMQLYRKTHDLLEQGPDFVRAEEKQRELLAQEVRAAVRREVEPEEVEAHFRHMPARYFLIHSAREITADVLQIHRFMQRVLQAEGDDALEPELGWHHEPDRGYTCVRLCTWDRPGLFSTLAGSFGAAGLNILHAQIFSRDPDGIALDTFFVADAHHGGPVGREARERFENIVCAALTGQPVDFPTLIARQKPARPLYHSVEGERLPTRIQFNNEGSPPRTVLEIETEDRLGLLFVISKVLARLGVNINVAKIVTEKGAAIDTFYVTEPHEDQQMYPILSPERHRQISDAIRGALAVLE